jgi:hypothetical protein
MIKESSIDAKRYELIQQQQKVKPPVNTTTPRAGIGYFDIKSDIDQSENNNLQNMLRNQTVNTEVQP